MHGRIVFAGWLKSSGLILGIGLLTGILTSRGQTYLPDGARQFANSYSVWLTVSFLIGLLLPSRGWALIGGAVVQFAALAGYYLASQVFFGAPPGGLGIVAFWAIGGICGGPPLGLAGFWWRGRSGRFAIVAGVLLGGVYLSEGFYLLFVLRYGIGYAFLLVGVILAAGLARGLRHALASVALSLPLGLVLYLCLRYGFGYLYDRLTLG